MVWDRGDLTGCGEMVGQVTRLEVEVGSGFGGGGCDGSWFTGRAASRNNRTVMASRPP
jgi:hypothetical protein